MLVVKVELWPLGDETKKRTLGIAHIANDGSGTTTSGNYIVGLSKVGGKTLWKQGRVEKFPRKRLGAWDLLYRALSNIVGNRNPTEERDEDIANL